MESRGWRQEPLVDICMEGSLSFDCSGKAEGRGVEQMGGELNDGYGRPGGEDGGC